MKKKKNKRTYIILGIVGGLLLFVVVGKKAGWIGNSGITKVATEKVTKHNIIQVVSASGNIYPKVEVKISPDVPGEIIELNVEEGDSVIAGQVLAKIKPDQYIAELDRTMAGLNTAHANELNSKSQLTTAKAQFDQAKINYDRNKKLHDNKVISDAEFEQIDVQYKTAQAGYESALQSVEAAGFNVKSAEAIVKQAKDNLTKTTIYAPSSGIVTKLNIEKGERVVGTSQFSGTEMMSIADLYAVEARVDVSENDVLKISLGDTANVELDAYTGRKFKGVVTQVAVSSKNSGTAAAMATDQVSNFTVKILLNRDSYIDMMDVKHKKFPFLPGMTASVKIMTKRVSDVLAVPVQSVTTREDSSKNGKMKNGDEKSSEVVFVLDKDHVKLRQVKTGIQDNQYIEILEGLKENEEVVVAPFAAISKLLKDGMLVKKEDKDKLFKEEK